jgi:hypothetical protein
MIINEKMVIEIRNKFLFTNVSNNIITVSEHQTYYDLLFCHICIGIIMFFAGILDRKVGTSITCAIGCSIFS